MTPTSTRVVDVSDFNVWNSNKFTSVAAWCAGDFNADGAVDVSDFNIWNANKFTAADGLAGATGRRPEWSRPVEPTAVGGSCYD